MGLYERHVLPRLVEAACGTKGFERWRARATDGLFGDVVEIGFGSGLNVAHYPAAVTRVLAVEPAEMATRRAAARIAATGAPVEHIGLDGQHLDLDDHSCDGALSTFTLCTIPDPRLALSELARVLKPGGQLHLLEHGLAPDASVATWQRRIDPLEKRLAGGCHLTRDPLALLDSCGFDIISSEQRYVKGPKPWSYLTLAVATSRGPSN